MRLVPGLLREPGPALPQPLPPEIWVPTAKGLMSTLSPSPLWLSPVSHRCCTAVSSHRNAPGVAGTIHHQHFLQRVLAYAMCHHGTGSKGTWGCWTPHPELWGLGCCQGQGGIRNIPRGTDHCHNKPPGSPNPRQHSSPPLAHRAMNGQRSLPKNRFQVLPEPSPLPSTVMPRQQCLALKTTRAAK